MVLRFCFSYLLPAFPLVALLTVSCLPLEMLLPWFCCYFAQAGVFVCYTLLLECCHRVKLLLLFTLAVCPHSSAAEVGLCTSGCAAACFSFLLRCFIPPTFAVLFLQATCSATVATGAAATASHKIAHCLLVSSESPLDNLVGLLKV